MTMPVMSLPHPLRPLCALGIALGTAALGVSAIAQPQGRPSRECMQEIIALCGTDRSQIRSCLRQRIGELSESCAGEVRSRAQQRREEGARRPGQAEEQTRAFQTLVRPTRTVAFGSHQRQQVSVFEPEGAVDELPMVVFVHGGGWAAGSHLRVQAKPAHFNTQEFYFASAGYRILPDYPVEQQAGDLGAALRALRGQASAIGFDRDRIVLMGHSAGAHLAALVATDPSYAGDAFDAIKGVILLDGAGYDVAANMAVAAPRGWQIYNTAFSDDPARQQALSPIAHVGGPDAPDWLALYVEDRAIARDQAEAFTAALNAAGVEAQAVPIAGTDHGRMNRELGTDEGAAQTDAVDAFLARVFG